MVTEKSRNQLFSGRRGLAFQQLFFGERGVVAQDKVNCYAIYSFKTLKLLRVSLTKPEALAFLVFAGMSRVILVEFKFANSKENKGSKRLNKVPDQITRLPSCDIRKSLFWVEKDL